MRRPPGSWNTASPAAPTSARSGRISAPPATRSTAPTPCSPPPTPAPGTTAGAPEPACPETEGPRITALARHDPETGTVTLVLDSTTASVAMFALAAHAGEREAHAREVERSSADWPDGSYGRRNRQAIAARETRIATRLRAVQHAYEATAGHDTTLTPPEPSRTPRSAEHTADREIELD